MKYLLIILAMFVSGCGIQMAENKNGAMLMTWKNDLSAAVVPPVNRKMCIQMALTSVDKKSETEAKVTDAMLSLFGKLPQDKEPNDLATISTNLMKTTRALNVSTEKTAFLIAGGFYLCQLQMNGMDDKDVKELASKWLELSSKLAEQQEQQ